MNYTLVGAFVVLLGAALVVLALWLASGGALRKKVDLYQAIEDESVAGLNLNAPVKYNGVEVGKVRDIALDVANPERVRLLLAIADGTPIKVDTVAVLKTQGLTGIAYVELGGGSVTSALLRPTATPPYPLIRTKPSLSTRLENVLTTVLAKLDHTSSTIDAVLSDENRLAFGSALADIAAVSRTLAERKGVIDAGIVNAARTFDHSAQASAQLGPVIERVGRGADAVRTMGDTAASAADQASRAVDRVGSELQRGAVDIVPELQRLLVELNALSISLKRVSDQAERMPSGLLSGRVVVPDGPGEGTKPSRPRAATDARIEQPRLQVAP